MHEYGLKSTKSIPNEKFDAVVLVVAHTSFLELNLDSLRNQNSILYDVKGVVKNQVDASL